MAYTPPVYNAVNFNFSGTYSPPVHNAVNFNFGIFIPGGAATVQEELFIRNSRSKTRYASENMAGGINLCLVPPAVTSAPFAPELSITQKASPRRYAAENFFGFPLNVPVIAPFLPMDSITVQVARRRLQQTEFINPTTYIVVVSDEPNITINW
jgi:hypothetical protein